MAQSQYTGVPTENPTSGGSGASYQSVPEATPAAFGAQIGEAEQKLGASGQEVGNKGIDLANHYIEMAAQAHADDIISNQLVPATTKISSDYYQTKGMAAHAAYQPTLDALQKAQSDAISGLPLYQQNLVRSFSVRHITNLQDGMMRHLDQQQSEYEKQSVNSFVGAQGDVAINAGSDANVVNQSIQNAVSKSILYQTSPVGGGIDPTDPQGKAILDENSKQIAGGIAQKVVESSIARGDVNFANTIYQQNKGNMDGKQQLEIEKSLHAENQKYTDQANVDAIINGKPLPPPVMGGMQVVQVKAAVAANAQKYGNDPNVALMISGLESSFGVKSDNIGGVQDNRSMEEHQKEATDTANKLFDGHATPAQIYTVYQQGIGGGPALFNNPNKRAVDVLEQFRSKDYDPVAAIVKNGGNVAMTSKQFTDMLQSKCDAMYGQVACRTTTADGKPIDLGKALVQPHQESGVTMQPTPNPLDALKQFDDNSASYYARANALPTIDSVNGAVKGLDEKRSMLTKLAEDYKNSQSANLHAVTALPDFYSLTDARITPEMRTFMGRDETAMKAANEMAKINREVSGKPDPTKYGPNWSQVQEDIVNHKLNTYSQLNDYMAKGMLNGDGVKQAKAEMETEYNLKERKAAAYAIVQAKTLGLFDNKGDAKIRLNTVMSQLPGIASTLDQHKISPLDYYDPSKPEFIGNYVKDFSTSPAQAIVKSATELPKERTVDDVLYDASKVINDPVKLQQYMEEAKLLGWKPAPRVPVETQ
jgi:hypothetical protein